MFIPWFNSEAAEGQSIKFYLNQGYYEVGSSRTVMDTAPCLNGDNRTLVPLRFLGNALGVADENIIWDSDSQTATLKQAGKTLQFTVGSSDYSVSGQPKQMDTVPELTGGRVMLPARYVAEAFGYRVYWVQNAKTVMITMKTLDTSKPMDILLLEDIVGESFRASGSSWKLEVNAARKWGISAGEFSGMRSIKMSYYPTESTEEGYQKLKRVINAFVPNLASEVNSFLDYDRGFVAERQRQGNITSDRWGDLGSKGAGREFGEQSFEWVKIQNVSGMPDWIAIAVLASQ